MSPPVSSFSIIFHRLSKLLLRLPALRLISAAVTEELFFAGLIGNVQIDSIIPYILKMESTDYNSQPLSEGVWPRVVWSNLNTALLNSTASKAEGFSDRSLNSSNLLYLWDCLLCEFSLHFHLLQPLALAATRSGARLIKWTKWTSAGSGKTYVYDSAFYCTWDFMLNFLQGFSADQICIWKKSGCFVFHCFHTWPCFFIFLGLWRNISCHNVNWFCEMLLLLKVKTFYFQNSLPIQRKWRRHLFAIMDDHSRGIETLCVYVYIECTKKATLGSTW